MDGEVVGGGRIGLQEMVVGRGRRDLGRGVAGGGRIGLQEMVVGRGRRYLGRVFAVGGRIGIGDGCRKRMRFL